MFVARKLHKRFLASMPTTESGSYANGLGSASKSSAGVSSNSKKALIESFERFVSEN